MGVLPRTNLGRNPQKKIHVRISKGFPKQSLKFISDEFLYKIVGETLERVQGEIPNWILEEAWKNAERNHWRNQLRIPGKNHQMKPGGILDRVPAKNLGEEEL